MGSGEGNLLSLREELVNVAVEYHFTDLADGNEVLGSMISISSFLKDLDKYTYLRPHLRRIKNVEIKFILLSLCDSLDAKLPLGIESVLDSLIQILPVEVRILSRQFQRFIPNERVHTQLGDPMELDKSPPPLRVKERKRIHAKPLHHPERSRDPAIAHRPRKHMRRLGMQILEVPEVVVRRLGLRHLVVWLGLRGMHKVGELNIVLDEEDGDVVSNNVPNAFVRIELCGEATYVTNSVGGAPGTSDGGETHEDGRGT